MAGKRSWYGRLKRWFSRHLWFFTGSLVAISLVLGYIGFKRYFQALGEHRSVWDLLYLDLQLFTLESGAVTGPVNWQLQMARLLSPAIAAFAALKALAMLFRDQLQQFRIKFIKNHVIICSLGRKGLLLAQEFIAAGHRVVVIEMDEGNALIPQCREKGAVVIIGNYTDDDVLNKARVKRAKYLISVDDDDGINTEVAVKCRQLVKDSKSPVLTCIVHIVNHRLCRLLRERELSMDPVRSFRLEFFNTFDMGARACLNDFPPFDEMGMANGRPVHLFVVGLGRLGENMVIKAAKKWQALKTGRKLHITILDRHAEEKIAFLLIDNPAVKTICDLHPIQMEIVSPGFQTADYLVNQDGSCPFTSVYICLDNASFALSTDLNIHRTIRHLNIPIVVRMAHHAGLATLLAEKNIEGGAFNRLYAFGLLDRTCTPAIIQSGTHEILAQVIHEEYRRKQLAAGRTTTDNPSLLPWPELPESLKEFNRGQADHISIKLKRLGYCVEPLTSWASPDFSFTREEIESMARLEHARWIEERKKHGWRFAPGPKNLKKKTSPHIVPWQELSEDIKELDRDTVRNIPFLLAQAGFQITPQPSA